MAATLLQGEIVASKIKEGLKKTIEWNRKNAK